jgi:hypothetical protein
MVDTEAPRGRHGGSRGADTVGIELGEETAQRLGRVTVMEGVPGPNHLAAGAELHRGDGYCSDVQTEGVATAGTGGHEDAPGEDREGTRKVGHPGMAWQ